jgi:hypothetical protein
VAVETVRFRNDTLVVAGTSNRENGTAVILDLQRGTRTVAVGDAEVNASGRWRTTVDASGVEAGEYTLRAETGDATDLRTVRVGVVTPASTPTPTPAPVPTPTETDGATAATDASSPGSTPTVTPTAAASDGTRDASARATRTGTTADGFGFAAAVTALAALLVALGRRP